MSGQEWCYVSGYVAGLETKLLTREFFGRLLRTETERDILALMTETELSSLFESPAALRDAEGRLDFFTRERLTDIRVHCPSPEPVDIFFSDVDFVNFKAVGKNLLLGLDEPFSAAGLVTKVEFERAWRGEEEEETYWGRLARAVEPRIRDAENKAYAMDLIVDGEHLRYVLDKARALASEFIVRYAETMNRVRLAQIVYRARLAGVLAEELKSSLLEGMNGKFDALLLARDEELPQALFAVLPEGFMEAPTKLEPPELERLADTYLISLAREAKVIPFGPEPVLGYVSGFMAQMRNLKLAIGGLVNNLPRERIEAKMRSLYV